MKLDKSFWNGLGVEMGNGSVDGQQWSGFVTKMDEDHIEVILRGQEWPQHDVSAWIGRSHVGEEVYSLLGDGVCITLEFVTLDDGQPRIDIKVVCAD